VARPVNQISGGPMASLA